ncbi:MAG: potassium-transporting ATPase subunit F [Acidimicrobiales bacterium]
MTATILEVSTADNVVGLVLAALAAIYLVVVLVWPEKF